MMISDHATRISRKVICRKRVGGTACDLAKALSSAARQAACTATVMLTRTQAKRIFESTVRVSGRQALAALFSLAFIIVLLVF
jgi:hypothetical protein